MLKAREYAPRAASAPRAPFRRPAPLPRLIRVVLGGFFWESRGTVWESRFGEDSGLPLSLPLPLPHSHPTPTLTPTTTTTTPLPSTHSLSPHDSHFTPHSPLPPLHSTPLHSHSHSTPTPPLPLSHDAIFICTRFGSGPVGCGSLVARRGPRRPSVRLSPASLTRSTAAFVRVKHHNTAAKLSALLNLVLMHVLQNFNFGNVLEGPFFVVSKPSFARNSRYLVTC